MTACLQLGQRLEPTSVLEEATQLWCATFSMPKDALRSSQKAWDWISSERAHKSLLERSNPREVALLKAAARPESGLWLHAIPNPALGTFLQPTPLRISVAQRVGAPVYQEHSCRCGSLVDELGHHALSCRLSGGRLPRHAALNDTLRRAFASAGYPSVLEPSGLDRGDGKRPDGMTLFPYHQGKSLVWDATCADTFAQSHLEQSAKDSASAAKSAEDGKRRKYHQIATRYLFAPFSFETTCVFGPSTMMTVNELGRKITKISGESRETLWLKQRLQFAILRGNSLSVMMTRDDDWG